MSMEIDKTETGPPPKPEFPESSKPLSEEYRFGKLASAIYRRWPRQPEKEGPPIIVLGWGEAGYAIAVSVGRNIIHGSQRHQTYSDGFAQTDPPRLTRLNPEHIAGNRVVLTGEKLGPENRDEVARLIRFVWSLGGEVEAIGVFDHARWDNDGAFWKVGTKTVKIVTPE